jgi:hypothetical protein
LLFNRKLGILIIDPNPIQFRSCYKAGRASAILMIFKRPTRGYVSRMNLIIVRIS